MTKTWLIKKNKPNEWEFNGVEIIKGKRETNEWINYIKSSKTFIKQININKLDPDVDLLNQFTINLDLSANNTLANTLTLVSRPDYIIQCTYRSDINATNSTDFNYFSSVINLDSNQIYGSCMFYKIRNNKLVDLELDEILTLLINFYYLKTYKLKNGKFEEIGLNNFEPDIDRMFRGYTIKKIKGWFIMTDDSKSNIENLKESNNDISQFNNLIWLRTKNYGGEMYEAIESLNMGKNECDLRGIYEDIDVDYIMGTFFN